MKQRILSILASLALVVSVASMMGVLSTPASAGTRDACIEPFGHNASQGFVNVHMSLAQGTYIGWSLGASVVWLNGYCGTVGVGKDPAIIDTQLSVTRDTIGGTVLCYLASFHNDHGGVYMGPTSVSAGNTGVCASTTWPAGYTHASLTFNLHRYWGDPGFTTSFPYLVNA